MSKFGFEGVRIADDLIYSEPNYAEPKEIHKSILSIINQNNFPSDFSICDIGCAAGEFLSHAKNIFPECKIIGLDVSEVLLTKAKEKLPEGEFLLETIEKENIFNERKFDVITITGVHAILDNPKPILMNSLSLIKNDGLLLVSGFFNPEPIDMITRYHRADKEDLLWEKGWNVHSCLTIENILKKSSYNLDIKWHDFVMPFPIKRQNDPMRTWTTQIGNNSNATINGACQIVNTMILEIHIKKS